MLWVDKYRPLSFKDLNCNTELTHRLKVLAQNQDFPHLLFHGPSGAGKRTRVLCLLKDLFGPGVENLVASTREYTINNSTAEITLLTSPFHIEVDLTAVGAKDRTIVQELIKELAQTRNVESLLESKTPKNSRGPNGKPLPQFKVLVLSPCSALSPSSQQALRRTMETYSSSIRLIMVTDSLSKVIQPIRSRCMCIRVPAPKDEEIVEVLEDIVRKEKVDVTTETTLGAVAKCNGNLRIAILSVQASLMSSKNLLEPEWEVAVDSIVDSIITHPYASTILEVRKKLYGLLSNCIPPQIILETLVTKFCGAKGGVPDGKFFDAAYWGAIISRRMAMGSHPIIHLEAFIARLMVIVGG